MSVRMATFHSYAIRTTGVSTINELAYSKKAYSYKPRISLFQSYGHSRNSYTPLPPPPPATPSLAGAATHAGRADR
jgi:hypothetical protein